MDRHKTPPITVRLTNEQITRLREYAKQKGMTLNQVIRLSVDYYLDNH